MTTAQTNLPIDLQIINGICFFLTPASRTGMGRMIGHDGATAYNFTDLLALPDSKLAVFVSTNTEGGSPLMGALAMRALQLAYQAKTGVAAAPTVSLPSTVTVPSQAVMQAVAGRYATNAGYDLINYDESGLLWTHNAQAGTSEKPAKVMRLAPTDDGWWASPDIPQTELGFQTLGGKRLMVIRIGGAPALRYAVLGQFATVQPLSDNWRQRLGTYRQVNASSIVPPFFVAEAIVLSVRDGLLTMSAPSSATFVLRPLQDDRAYTFGTGLSLGRGMGDALEFDGQRFTFLGVTYEKVTR
jgi:hypothetical protein